MAGMVVVPAARIAMPVNGTPIPAFFEFALHIDSACFHSLTPLAIIGAAILVVALLRRGPARLVSFCQNALPLLAGFSTCLAIYLLSSGGGACKLAIGDQMRETTFYKRTLEQFALLETAQGRLEKLREGLRKDRSLKAITVSSVSEFSDTEARERISSLMEILPKITDPATKRQILATLCLFRKQINTISYVVRELPRYATEAGAPPTNTPAETLDWIANNLHKDGWEPGPLIKLNR